MAQNGQKIVFLHITLKVLSLDGPGESRIKNALILGFLVQTQMLGKSVVTIMCKMLVTNQISVFFQLIALIF